jgi:hypothetical protein
VAIGANADGTRRPALTLLMNPVSVNSGSFPCQSSRLTGQSEESHRPSAERLREDIPPALLSALIAVATGSPYSPHKDFGVA